MRTSSNNPSRGEVWQVSFDPAVGAEIQKPRPAVVMNPDTVGRLPLRIVAPLTEWDEKWERILWMVNVPKNPRNGLSKDSGADAFQVKSLSLTRQHQRAAKHVPELARVQAVTGPPRTANHLRWAPESRSPNYGV